MSCIAAVTPDAPHQRPHGARRLDEQPEKRFSANDATRELVRGKDATLGHFVDHQINKPKWDAWKALPEAVKTGQVAFAVAHGGLDMHQVLAQAWRAGAAARCAPLPWPAEKHEALTLLGSRFDASWDDNGAQCSAPRARLRAARPLRRDAPACDALPARLVAIGAFAHCTQPLLAGA